MRGVNTKSIYHSINYKTLFLTILVLAVFFVAACQIPQYTPPAGAAPGSEENDVSKELEQLTNEVKDENKDAAKEAEAKTKEMTPEEKAREEFKRKLLEKQAEAQKAAEAKPAEPVVKTEEKKVEPAKPTETEPAKVEAKAAPKAEPKTVSTPAKDASGELTLALNEGDLVALKLKATDPDGDKLTYAFDKPLNAEGKWQTKAGDAGDYNVKISVSDGKNTVSSDLKIVVTKLNKAPVLENIADVKVKEGDTVTLAVKAADADDDKLTYSYSGWMTAPSYTTNYNDAGDHEVTVTVSDGKESASQKVKVTVEDVNRAPTLEW